MMDYGDLKKAFYEDLNGSSRLDVLVSTSPAVFGLLLWSLLKSRNVESVVLELVLVVPWMASLTLLHGLYVSLGLLVVCVLVWLGRAKNFQAETLTLTPLFSIYRSFLLLLTCFCILAVDFPLFPRRFAKTETHGVSVMDVGVGSFVFAAGLTSKPWVEVYRSRKYWIRLVWLLALGLLRVVLVKNTGYSEHVSEYGVSWNFFLTLTVMQILAPLVPDHLGFVIGLGVLNECLQRGGLEDIALSQFRTDAFLSQNKEGLISLPGYLFIFICARWAKRHVQHLKSLIILTTVLGVLNTLCSSPSRRAGNGPYTLWVLFFNLVYLLLFASILKIYPFVPTFAQKINTHAQSLFLLANILTGLVNLNMHTIHTGPLLASVVLLTYMAFLMLFVQVMSTVNQQKV